MRVCSETADALINYAKNGRVVVFDTETTGMEAEDEICQIAAAEYVNGELKRKLNIYVKATCEIKPDAAEAHGLTLEFLHDNGKEPGEAMKEFFDFVGKDVLLVAHNIRFDKRLVHQECDKFNVPYELGEIETCDTWALARYLHPEFECYRLGYLLEQLKVRGENSHDAMDDVLACGGVFFKLAEELGKYGWFQRRGHYQKYGENWHRKSPSGRENAESGKGNRSRIPLDRRGVLRRAAESQLRHQDQWCGNDIKG